MRNLTLRSFVVGSMAIALGFGEEAWAQDAPGRPYLYVSLDEAIPEGFDSFEPVSITDSRRIYGTLSACDGDLCSYSVAVYRRGEIAALQEGVAIIANNRGKVGGYVDLDLALGTFQAALFARGQTKLIPPLVNEVGSLVSLLSDSNIAFVESYDSDSTTYYLTRRGSVVPLDFGPDPARHFDINDRGRISGTSSTAAGARAFRYSPFSNKLTVLEPLATDRESYGEAINTRGDVLGFSDSGAALERVGVWRGTKFHPYFVEGTPEFPTISNRLLWNERGLIVITDAHNDPNSYLVPRPGVRLNIADLTEGPLPVWIHILDINNRGDMIGVGGEEDFDRSTFFLLRRVGPLDDRGDQADGVAAASPPPAATAAAAQGRHVPAPERILHQRLYRGLEKSRTAKRAGLRHG